MGELWVGGGELVYSVIGSAGLFAVRFFRSSLSSSSSSADKMRFYCGFLFYTYTCLLFAFVAGRGCATFFGRFVHLYLGRTG